MEDLTSTAAVFSKDELSAMCRHMVIGQVTKILEMKKSIENNVDDVTKPRALIFTEIREQLFDMTVLWGDLGPARAVARRLFINPDQHQLFDALDNSLTVENVYEDLKFGRPLSLEKSCFNICCKSSV